MPLEAVPCTPVVSAITHSKLIKALLGGRGALHVQALQLATSCALVLCENQRTGRLWLCIPMEGLTSICEALASR